MILVPGLQGHWRGLLAVLGAFLCQLCAGAYHGTFGNLLPYLTSYIRQAGDDVNNGDVAKILSVGGLAQGVSFIVGGLILVPCLGSRLSLALAAGLYSLAPLLTHLLLVHGLHSLSPGSLVWSLALVYGGLSSASLAVVTIVTMTTPVMWFPQHRGKVIGFIASGFGLASTVFVPLQSFLVNPSNVAPANSSSSPGSYFTEAAVLAAVPRMFLVTAATYAAVFALAVAVTVGPPEKEADTEGEKRKEDGLGSRLVAAWDYMYRDAGRRLEFYLLWLARFLFLTVGAGVLTHWKTFSFTQTDNDQVLSIVGSVSGIVNFLGRLVAGVLFDRLGYSWLMSGTGLLLAATLASIYTAGQHIQGLIACVWLVYFLGFAHFSTIPAQVHRLFPGQFASVVIGCIGLAESFSYGALGVLNTAIMTDEDNPSMFLTFFLVLAACSLMTVPVSFFVKNGFNTTALSWINQMNTTLKIGDMKPDYINNNSDQRKSKIQDLEMQPPAYIPGDQEQHVVQSL